MQTGSFGAVARAADVLDGKLSRRAALQSLAVVGALRLPTSRPSWQRQPASILDTFDHVVVLMLENRSFDNLLGYLYQPGEAPRGQSFEGVAGKNLTNPIPSGAADAQRRVVPGDVMDNPNPDPGEGYPHVNTQLFGTVLLAANSHQPVAGMVSPFNAPDPLPAPAPMNGFVHDYVDTFTVTMGRPPTYDEYKVTMACYPADQVPVLSTLAREFAVCDHWHCAVPSQTFCNRAFFHSATSSGGLINAPYAHWVAHSAAETIFNRFDALGNPRLTWKVYFDTQDAFPLTGLLHYGAVRQAFATNFATMDRFLADARTGNLPSYAFIEPRLFINHNDMHPPIRVLGHTQPSSILAGEQLVARIYDAIRSSDSATGSNALNTLFVITFDEHGGCYDHVPPRVAEPPDASAPAGQMGFRFDRLGVRVPAILVSPHIAPGTVVNASLDHGSFLKMMAEKWTLGHLTERDRTAPSLADAVTPGALRDPAAWPQVTPRPFPTDQAHASNADQPLNELQHDVVGLAVALSGANDQLREDLTVVEAIQIMERVIGRPGTQPATPTAG